MKQIINYGYALEEELSMEMDSRHDKMSMSQSILGAVVDLYIIGRLDKGDKFVGKDDIRGISSSVYEAKGRTFMRFYDSKFKIFGYVSIRAEIMATYLSTGIHVDCNVGVLSDFDSSADRRILKDDTLFSNRLEKLLPEPRTDGIVRQLVVDY